jgi:protein-tyrosine phosphatase
VDGEREGSSGARERRLDFEGAVNFRDLGGYPALDGRRTRWRRLFRADSLADLTPSDLERLTALGLRTLIDFRLPEERLLKPNRLPRGDAIRCIELGFVPEGTLQMLRLVKSGAIESAEVERRVIAQYRRFCVDHHHEYRRMFEVAGSSDSYPLLIHCTSGKDRTGYGAALMLLSVGVSRDIVIDDYGLTNNYQRAIPQLLGSDTPEAVARILLAAQSKYLEAAFNEIDRVYGSFDAYLDSALGVDDLRRAALVELLTETYAKGSVPITRGQRTTALSPDQDIGGTRPQSDQDASA